MRLRLLLPVALVLGALSSAAFAQSNYPAPGGQTVPGAVVFCLDNTSQAVVCSLTNPLPVNATVSVSATVTFPSIAAAVPATGIYDGINVGGTLRGWTGVNPSGSIYAGQIDLAAVAGATVKAGAGTAAGALRVELPTDGTGIVGVTAIGAVSDAAWVSGNGTAIALLKNIANGVGGAIPAGTNLIGGVNVAQVNAVTVLTGTGAVGTGAQRIAVGTDTATIAGSAPGTAGTASANVLSVQGIASMTPLLANPGTAANWAVAATGAAPPANISYMGTNSSGATGGLTRGTVSCDSHVFKHITSATDTVAVQGVASQSVYVCSWRARAAGVATWYLENTASANANCSSTLTQLTGVATEAANTGETWGTSFWGGLKNTSGNGLCINSTGTGGVDIDIWYAQF